MHVLTEASVAHEGREDVADLAEQLGLFAQAQRYRKASVEDAFKPLTTDEVWLWKAFCPRNYRGDALKAYRFDTIPVEVLRHWKAIRDRFEFDEFQIWTTERSALDDVRDPILVGIHGPSIYQLARWGLESPGNLTIQAIAEQLMARWRERAAQLPPDYPFQSLASRIRNNLLWLEDHSDDRHAIRAARRVLGQ